MIPGHRSDLRMEGRVDNPGVNPPDPISPEAHLLYRRRRKVFDDDIGNLDEFPKRFFPLARALLVSIQADKIAAAVLSGFSQEWSISRVPMVSSRWIT